MPRRCPTAKSVAEAEIEAYRTSTRIGGASVPSPMNGAMRTTATRVKNRKKNRPVIRLTSRTSVGFWHLLLLVLDRATIRARFDLERVEEAEVRPAFVDGQHPVEVGWLQT